jgi:acetoacetyl-CoA reductase
MGTLAGAVVIITGAGRGIGRAIAEELGRGGARVVVNYSKSKEAAEELVARLLEKRSSTAVEIEVDTSNKDIVDRFFENGAVAIQADVSDPAQASRLIEETIRQFGRIDVLVNNAGINIDRSMKNLTTQDWDKVIQVDLSSYFYTVKAALPYFMQQKSGKIINISSLNGEIGSFGQANYSAAKAGIIGFTRTAALELARYNVTVNDICPGYIATEMFETVPEKTKDAILAHVPLGRLGTPQEVARAVRYLIVDGDYYTGASLNMNGGVFMQ